MGRHFRIGRWAALSAVALLAACKPAPEKPFEPYFVGKGYIDTTNPNCHLGYKAFHKHAMAKAHAGWDVLQPAAGSGQMGVRTLWAKVEVFEPPAEGRLYVFTLPGHPAHPAVLMKNTSISSEGVSWYVNGCGWGDRKAFIRFRSASQALSDAFEAEVKQYPWPEDASYATGQAPDDERIHAPKDQLVSTVADQAHELRLSGRELSALYAIASGDQREDETTATFTWLEHPRLLADRFQILDLALVDIRTQAGSDAVLSWCSGPEGPRTPKFCRSARARNSEWSHKWPGGVNGAFGG